MNLRYQCTRWLLVPGILVGSAALGTISVTPVPGDPLRGDGNTQRNLVTYQDLFSPKHPSSPVDDAAFTLPQNAARPEDVFEGRLDLMDTVSSGGVKLVHQEFSSSGDISAWFHLPRFSFEFVQNGSHLIPVNQGLVFTGTPAWNYIIGPGRVWREEDDSGYSRASFPFALVERNQNCVHNGEMMFLFSNRKRQRISNVRYQVTQETCKYLKLDMWGQLAATYSYYRIAHVDQLRTDHAMEIANRIPRKSFAALGTDFKDSDVNLAGFFKTVKHLENITTYGLYINGVDYAGPCHTRYGEYAFCEEMRLPSYSTAKSAFVSVAMMRLAKLYGRDVYRQLIRDYVLQCTQGEFPAKSCYRTRELRFADQSRIPRLRE